MKLRLESLGHRQWFVNCRDERYIRAAAPETDELVGSFRFENKNPSSLISAAI